MEWIADSGCLCLHLGAPWQPQTHVTKTLHELWFQIAQLLRSFFFFIMSMCLGRPVSLNITTARQNSSLLTQGMMHVYHTVLWHTLLKYMHKILHYFGDCHRKTTDIPHKRRRKCIREKERTVKYITFLHMSERRDRY